jgi:hypothetical protein
MRRPDWEGPAHPYDPEGLGGLKSVAMSDEPGQATIELWQRILAFSWTKCGKSVIVNIVHKSACRIQAGAAERAPARAPPMSSGSGARRLLAASDAIHGR